MSSYKILACDGGGIRGVFTAELIKNLVEDAGDFLPEIDLFAGTSVGSANALALAAGRSPQGMVDFYRNNGADIFGTRLVPSGVLGDLVRALEDIPDLGKYVADFDNLFLPKWDNAALHRAVHEFFGTTTLFQLRRKVTVPTLAVDQSLRGSKRPFTVPVVMDNFSESPYGDVLAADAMMRSGAAPTIFASFQGFVDGGLVANNPSMVGVAAAVDPSKGGRELGDVRVLSIGTGLSPEGIADPQPLKWGLLEWGPIIYNVSSTSVMELDAIQAARILGPHFCRLNLVLPKPIPLDDAKAVPELIALADKMREDGDPAYLAALEFIKREFAEVPRA